MGEEDSESETRKGAHTAIFFLSKKFNEVKDATLQFLGTKGVTRVSVFQ